MGDVSTGLCVLVAILVVVFVVRNKKLVLSNHFTLTKMCIVFYLCFVYIYVGGNISTFTMFNNMVHYFYYKCCCFQRWRFDSKLISKIKKSQSHGYVCKSASIKNFFKTDKISLGHLLLSEQYHHCLTVCFAFYASYIFQVHTLQS